MRFSTLIRLALAATCLGTPARAAEFPENSRSRKAIARVRPALEIALHEKGLRFGSPIFVRIIKESSELELWVEAGRRFELFRTYRICKYSGRLGPKLRIRDGQSPEGFYFVMAGSLYPASKFHLALNLGYPNAYDRAHGRAGGALMVHGNCVSVGCYAMTDPIIEEIYALVDAALRNGQPLVRVHVFPFRMTPHKMQQHGNSRWLEFWQNLKEGYDFFERTGRPPNVLVRHGKYVFEDS